MNRPAPSKKDILAAAFIAPITAPLAAIVIMTLFGSPNLELMGGLVFVVGAVVSYFVSFFFGVPVVLALRNKGELTSRNVVIAGVTIGGVIGVAVLMQMRGTAELPPLLLAWAVAVPMIYGFIVSGTFALLAFHDRAGDDQSD